jgi:hypothetical protein
MQYLFIGKPGFLLPCRIELQPPHQRKPRSQKQHIQLIAHIICELPPREQRYHNCCLKNPQLLVAHA